MEIGEGCFLYIGHFPKQTKNQARLDSIRIPMSHRIMDEIPSEQPKQRRVRDPEAVRARLLDAAEKAFAQNGFEGATLPKIAAEAGISTPLIVHHYKSKLLLWEAVFERLSEGPRAELAGILAQHISAAERLRQVIAFHVQFYARSPAVYQLVASEGHRFSERLTWICERFGRASFKVVTDLIVAAQQEGAARMLSPERLRYAIIGVASIPAVAAEFETLTGRDPRAPAEVEATIAFINALIFVDGK